MAGIAVRKLSRLGNELHLTSTLAVARFVPGHFELGVIVIMLLNRCAEDWTADGIIQRPAVIRHVSSINAMAASLGRP